MARHAQNTSFLKDGAVLLYQRNDIAKPVWQCRIKFADQPYIRQSLKTQNRADAIRKAEKLYDDLRYRMERGMPISSPQFPHVVDVYLEWLEDEVEQETDDAKAKRLSKKLIDHRKFTKYAREFFETLRVDQITDADIDRYREWRKTYFTRGPGSKSKTIEYVRNGRTIRAPRPKSGVPALSTLASEDVVLRSIFERARKLGWVNGDQIPVIKSQRSQSNRRPAFEEWEMKRLLAIAEQRVEDAPNDRVRFQRGMLWDFCSLLANTGMRPFEAMKLEGRHISTFKTPDGKHATKMFVSGKNKERTLVGRDDTTHQVYAIMERLTLHRYQDGGFIEDEDGPLFVDPDDKPVKSFKKGLKALLDAAGLRKDDRGMERDAYSFRHYYATQRLLKGISVYTLAENMGTSVAMIEKHYGHVRPELAADELTRE